MKGFIMLPVWLGWVEDLATSNVYSKPFPGVPAYFLTNFIMTTGKLFNKEITASLNIHNLFDVNWLDPGFRTADGFLFSTVLEQLGINGLFKVTVNV